MSIYFFSIGENRVQALTGVKCIVFPNSDLYREFIDKVLSTNNEGVFSERINKILEQQYKNIPNEFEEEYNHFQCITESIASGTFHLRNVICRVFFSSTNKKKLFQNEHLKYNKAYKQVIKYYIDYCHFHYCSYPYIENYHTIITETKITNEDILYADRVRESKDYLLKLQKVNPLVIGNIIDEEYLAYKKDNIVTTSFFKKGNGEFNSKVKKMFILFYYDIVPLLLNVRTCVILVKKVLKTTKIFPYLYGRFFSKKIKHNTGNLPSFISGDTQIDPVGFASNQQLLDSSEIYLSKDERFKNDLLWHILSRVALIFQFKQFGWAEEKTKKYLQMLREFFIEWQPKNIGSESIMSGIDNSIIIDIYKNESGIFDNKMQSEFYPALVTYSLRKYTEAMEDSINEEVKIAVASHLNCTYHHI